MHGTDEASFDTRPLILLILDGFNVYIYMFAYRQAGSGKAYAIVRNSHNSRLLLHNFIQLGHFIIIDAVA